MESTYEKCLAYELTQKDLSVDVQKELPISYKGLKIDAGYRLDLFVENKVIVELKAVEKLLPIHEAQLLTYLKLSNYNLGLLINFNVVLLKNGIRRIVNELPQ